MAKKCLVTTLKSTFNNDNLLTRDEFIIHNVTSIDNFRILSGVEGGKATIMGDGYFVINGTHTKEYNTETGDDVELVCNGEVNIKVNKKKNVTFVRIPHFYMEDFANVANLKTIEGTSFSGDIGSFENTKITRYAISGSDVYGDISKLPAGAINCMVRFTAVTASNLGAFVASAADSANIYILLTGNQALTGTIEGIVDACVDAGRVNKTIILSLRDTSVTFGGSNNFTRSAEPSSGARLKWTDKTHITYQCGSDDDVSNPNLNIDIWAKGATSEQISIWESQGNTVHVVS